VAALFVCRNVREWGESTQLRISGSNVEYGGDGEDCFERSARVATLCGAQSGKYLGDRSSVPSGESQAPVFSSLFLVLGYRVFP